MPIQIIKRNPGSPQAAPASAAPPRTSYGVGSNAVSNSVKQSDAYKAATSAKRESIRPSANILEAMSRKNQVCEQYEKIKKECRGGKLYVDKEFPAVPESVYHTEDNSHVKFARPKDIHPKPKLFSGGASRFDIQQGELGDCWVLAAVANLAMNPELFNMVVPSDQDFDDNYCGAFHFRFWRFGKWVDVIVDDQLPVDHKTKLLMMQSTDSDEFWSALLEKAYAKINGGYEHLIGGTQAEAMEDFTGGMCEVVDTSDKSQTKKLWKTMLQNAAKSSMMGCSIDAEDDEEEEGELDNGLLTGHAYSVTDCKEITHKGKTSQLVRVRNPWGDDTEWNGDWSDKSRQWDDFTDSDKKKYGIVFSDDGEFWMCFDDFIKNYTKVEVCHLGPESLGNDVTMAGNKKSRWEMTLLEGSWTKGANAGGCSNFKKTFWMNPAFVVTVVDADDDDDEDMGTIIVGLMQKDMRKKAMDFWTIGYTIYKVADDHKGLLDADFFAKNKRVDKSPQFIDQREVCGRHKLKPGRYAIVPSTFNPNEEGEFILRIFSEKSAPGGELDEANEISMPSKPISEPKDEKTKQIQLELEEKMREAFANYAGPRGAINAYDLKDILNAALGSEVKGFVGFNLEACRSLLASMDDDFSGIMEFEEFKGLWDNLRTWKAVYKQFDADNDGSFDTFELRQALNSIGFRVNNRLFAAISKRYGDPKTGTVCFEDYILLLARLSNAFSFCTSKRSDGGDLKCPEEEALMHTVYV